MHDNHTPASLSSLTRRHLVAGAASAAALSPLAIGAPAVLRRVQDERTLKVGLVGCGGRGTGAALQALSTAGAVKLVAMADAFEDRLEGSYRELINPDNGVADRVDVPKERRFFGFDACARLLREDVDVVVLATPPHFRPDQFEAAIAAGKHVFMEKPVAVDGQGVAKVLAAGKVAASKGLSVGVGLQRHHQRGYLETLARVNEGAIGDIVAAHCYWNMGGLWMNERQPAWSDTEWQMRNWLYFTWLSGDHIVEQHIHNLDVVNWFKRDVPVSCHGMGGRQVRTSSAYGHIFDHHAVVFEYADGTQLFSQCRQIDGTANRVSEHLIGSKGRAHLDSGSWRIEGATTWQHGGRGDNDPYQTEHDDLFAAIRSGKRLDETEYGAMSTLTAIMGRVASYTGRDIKRADVLADTRRLGPAAYTFGELAVDPIPMPGQA